MLGKWPQSREYHKSEFDEHCMLQKKLKIMYYQFQNLTFLDLSKNIRLTTKDEDLCLANFQTLCYLNEKNCLIEQLIIFT